MLPARRMTRMFFGAHVSTAGGIHRAIERAVDIGADAVQVFTQSPRMWRAGTHRPEDVERWHELRAEHAIQGAVSHAIYLINIASDDPELHDKSTAALSASMDAAELLALDAVIFHPGSRKQGQLDDACLDRMARAIHTVLERSESSWLLLENSAGQGGTIGRDLDELAAVIHRVGDHPRLGVCLDTCHWYVSGVDVTDRSVLDHQLSYLDEAIGLHRLRALHINDAKTPLGSNRDRHENIGDGEMGAQLATFLQHPLLQHLGAYLEVPGSGDGPDADQLARVRSLHTGP